jgi:hypothetical protein
MEYRGFTIAGIVNRSYALCDMCEHWFEFCATQLSIVITELRLHPRLISCFTFSTHRFHRDWGFFYL